MNKPLPKAANGLYLIHFRAAHSSANFCGGTDGSSNAADSNAYLNRALMGSVFAYPIFLAKLGQSCMQSNTRVVAYALLSNEVVLLAQPDWPIDHWLDRFALPFARWHHRVYDHQGSVFANEFSAVLVAQNCWAEAIRYVHQCPVQGRLTICPSQYPWTSYHDYASIQSNNDAWLDKPQGLSAFGHHPQKALRKCLAYIAQPYTHRLWPGAAAIHGTDDHFRLWTTPQRSPTQSSRTQTATPKNVEIST